MERILLFIRRRIHAGGTGRHNRLNPILPVALLAGLLACSGIGLLELRLRPVVESLAAVQVQNRVTGDINAVLSRLSARYSGLVSAQYDQQGAILALTTDMAAVNRLRDRVAEQALEAVERIDVHELGVPLGSLFDIDLAWAKGPAVRVHSLVAGTVQTQMHSEFTSAGINQTLHRLILEVRVPLTVILPGISTQTEVNTRVCVAETVIVGRVPNTFLGLPQKSGTEG